MEIKINNHQRQNSFEFEFEFTAPPTSPNSPADRLFFNGHLLPHEFPSCQPTTNITILSSLSRSTSGTSSVSSKNSLMSSRSNSTNSSCSSARTSTSSDQSVSSERKQLKNPSQASVSSVWYGAKKPALLTPHYGSSRRWQFITPAPALKHQGSRTMRKIHSQSSSNEGDHEEKSKSKSKSKSKKKKSRGGGRWFGWRFLRYFVSTCQECHAIKPTKVSSQ